VEYIPQLDDITLTGMQVADGHAIPSDDPGLGIAWDWKAIAARQCVFMEFKQ
jgi:L-alanine-DL-glutamate epimerase-like enolase superfamily enzyme